MAIPFPRLVQMLSVTRRKEGKDQKFQFQQSVFLAHWIYTVIPKDKDHQTLSLDNFMEMYGLQDKKAAYSDLKSEEEILARHKEEIRDAYRRVECIGVPNPFKGSV